MSRLFTDYIPNIINTIKTEDKKTEIIEIATTNEKKLQEFQRLIKNKTVVGIKLDIDEIQSLDPYEVASKKAKLAWEKNSYNPILVEDTSLDIAGLNNRPGTLTTFFTSDPKMRSEICKEWLLNKDRRATARVILSYYEGTEVFLFEGTTSGEIAQEPKGSTEFGWDDMFIPDNQPKNERKTFAQMTPDEKDVYSMRRKAAEKLSESNIYSKYPILELPEPFNSELKRVDIHKIQDKKAIEFAYLLESINGCNPDNTLEANTYKPLIEIQNPYYLSYCFEKTSPSIGLILTDIDRTNTKKFKNGRPILWQMGPERRKLAIAQRAEYFIKNNDEKILKLLIDLEKNPTVIPHRRNKRDPAIESLLGGGNPITPTIYARAIPEIGYKKISSNKIVSRYEIAKYGLFNKIGKYPRLVYGIGSMPSVSGWKDVITTAIIGQIPVFIARNSVLADGTQRRIELIKKVHEDLDKLDLPKNEKNLYTRNIGVALGTNNPKEVVKEAEEFYEKTGVKLFRIYTINSDPRVIETAKLLRKTFKNDVEIFAGQLADYRQAKTLVEEAQIDAMIFGHGGGRQCTSATNGMAISTVEEIYSVIKDEFFNNTTLIVEGGVAQSVGPLFILGVDAILYNQQLIRGTIEAGGIFLQNHQGDFVQPYHGSASAPTMIIEASYKNLHELRINPSGRTKVTEGKPGYSRYSEKANSMTFWIDEFKHYAARTLADLGVENFQQLRKFLQSSDLDLLRIVSTEAARTATAYGSN